MISKTIACMLAMAMLAGCDKIGNPLDAVTGNRAKPDEFRVQTRKPLQMPGAASLPEPRLGERSPLEHDPGADARVALTGDPAFGRAATASDGERALVGAATSRAGAASGPVGASLAERETRSDANKPYEPPTVVELITGNKPGTEKEVLDPDAEARRLRTSGGAVTPINPRDVAAEGEEGETGDGYVSPGKTYEPKFPYGNQRKGS